MLYGFIFFHFNTKSSFTNTNPEAGLANTTTKQVLPRENFEAAVLLKKQLLEAAVLPIAIPEELLLFLPIGS